MSGVDAEVVGVVAVPVHEHAVLVVMSGDRWQATCKVGLETWTSEDAEVPAEVLVQVEQARELAAG